MYAPCNLYSKTTVVYILGSFHTSEILWLKALLTGVCIINEVHYGSHPFILAQQHTTDSTMVKALLMLHCYKRGCDYPSEMTLFRSPALYPDCADVALFCVQRLHWWPAQLLSVRRWRFGRENSSRDDAVGVALRSRTAEAA